jgi:hypothetical protein
MTTEESLFTVGGQFEQGEITGNVRLGKFEAQYEELFAEALEDGVITEEERERLDRAASSLGLDRPTGRRARGGARRRVGRAAPGAGARAGARRRAGRRACARSSSSPTRT